MIQSQIACSEDEDKQEQFKKLKAGDILYQPECYHTPEEGMVFKVHRFVFKNYGINQHANHTEVDLNDSGAVYGTIFDERFPAVDIPNTDLTIGYYFSAESATDSFIEAMQEVLDTAKAYKDSLTQSGKS